MRDAQAPLLSVAYVSTAAQLMSDADLFELLLVSQVNNAKADVTGMLLYHDGNFLQILEGPKDAVEATLRRVERDPRHFGLLVLCKLPIAERQFGDWSMAFKNLGEIPAEAQNGFSSFLKNSFLDESFRKEPDLMYRLALSFKENLR